MASKSDLSVCNSYKEFGEKLHYHRVNIQRLNDVVTNKFLPQEKLPGKDASSQLLRGLFTEVVATWEKYVQEILQEAVETVFKIVLDADSAQAAITATSSRELFKRAMVHHILLDDSGRRRESTDDKVKSKEEVANLTKRESSIVELSVNLVVQPNFWKELLVTFKESLLKRCDHVFPLLHGEDGIDSKFKSLFDTSRCLSDIIIEMGPVGVSFLARNENHSLEINSSQSLNDILRLYYGARCTFAHGENDRTFKTGGALHNFPSKSEFQSQVGEVAGDYLYIVYSYVKEYGSEAWIYCPTLINLQRFMRAIAFRLLAAISKWVYDEFGICIWNFDPAKEVAKIEDSMDNDDLPKQNSGSFAANFGNPGPSPQPLNAQGFRPPGSFQATNWQQPNQPPTGMAPLAYPSAVQGNQLGGPREPQSQMMPTQPPVAQQAQPHVLQFPTQIMRQRNQQMFSSPGGMATASPLQMIDQPQQGYFPPGSNIASPPPGSLVVSSSGFTSPPYTVHSTIFRRYSSWQESVCLTMPSFGTPGTMLTNDDADPIAKLLPLSLSSNPSKEKPQPGNDPLPNT